MRIVLKLFANLETYLPADRKDRNVSEIEVGDDATPAWVIEHYGIPADLAHLVLINGIYVPPDERGSRRFAEHDELAIFPPVAGG